jgi:hypothetical protein
MYVTITAQSTHSQVHTSRGYKNLDAIGIVPHTLGTSVHNGWKASGLSACSLAACTVPILHEMTAPAEKQSVWWMVTRDALLLDRKKTTEHVRTRETLGASSGKHRLACSFLIHADEGDLAYLHATTPPGQRGRVTQHDTCNLPDCVHTDRHAVRSFLEHLRIPIDNELTAYCTPSAWFACL